MSDFTNLYAGDGFCFKEISIPTQKLLHIIGHIFCWLNLKTATAPMT